MNSLFITFTHDGANTTSTNYAIARRRFFQCRDHGQVSRSGPILSQRVLTPARRTGLILPQQKLDEHGLEEVSNLFSSPKKPSPLKQMFTAEELSEENGNSTGMVGMDSMLRPQSQTYCHSLPAATLFYRNAD